MSYNSNTHYTPRYGKNHSKKIYDSGTGGREGVTLQGNQSSSTYIGSAGKDRETGTSSLSYSSSRRDTYGGSGYRSRYESYTPKTVRLVVILITGLDQKVEVLIMDPEAIQLMGKALLVE